MINTKLLGVAAAICVAFLSPVLTGMDEPKGPKKVKLQITPSPRLGEPWVASTGENLSDLVRGMKSPRFKLTVERVQPMKSANASFAVFANRIAVRHTDSTADNPLYLVGRGEFFPAGEKEHSFDFDATPAIVAAEKAGELISHRPLVFSFLLVPREKSQAFTESNWSLLEAVLTISDE